ncbi:hypothetical protein FQN49_005869 [Arthroderma sp. PD_2]|nr:hypothetical protein FQN49_005869 [Arthroderma sp. PD_2]
MDRDERLKMLFAGEDESLLHIDVGLRENEWDPTPAPAPAPAAPTTVAENSTVWSPHTKYACWTDDTAKEGSDDDAFEDEYLASFSRSAKKEAKASMNKKSTKSKKYKTQAIRSKSAGIVGSSSSNRGPSYFCPLLTIARFPYKFVIGEDAGRIAKAYFDGGQFWDRAWDLYYIHPPAYVSLRPLILIPKAQAQDLIDTINEEFDCKLSLPADPDAGVVVPFTPDGTPQPQFIGTSLNREMKDQLEQSVPSAPSGNSEPGQNASPELKRSFDAFREKMEAAYAATRRKSKKAKGKRQQTQAQHIRSWYRELKRTQCYLGLRPRVSRDAQNQTDATVPSDASWSEQQLAEKKIALANGSVLEPLDVDDPAPFAFADEPIFICIDVESNEKHHEQITEIGVSTLDTLDLTALPPGEGGRNWMEKIRCRHFRISEYADVTNRLFVTGCPERFEFGYSEFVPLNKSAHAVDSCFRAPYSAHIPYKEDVRCFKSQVSIVCLSPPFADIFVRQGNRFVKIETVEKGDCCGFGSGGVQLPLHVKKSSTKKTPAQAARIKTYKLSQRKIILVGHSLSTDIAYLQRLGCKTFDPRISNPDTSSQETDQPILLDSIDTVNLFRVLKRDSQPSALAKVLLDLGISGWHLHNAGNDARYTLESMIGVAIKAIQNDNSPNNGDKGGINSKKTAGSGKVDMVNGSTSAPALRPTPRSSEEDLHWRREVEHRIAAKREEAETRVREECALWEAAMGWNGESDSSKNDFDGGLPRGLNLVFI